MSNFKQEGKKVYLKSGNLEWVGQCTGPLEAVRKAMQSASGKSITLDPYFFFIDERGFRTTNAEYKVETAEGLLYAGFVFDDED